MLNGDALPFTDLGCSGRHIDCLADEHLSLREQREKRMRDYSWYANRKNRKPVWPVKGCDWKIIGSTNKALKVLNEAKTEWAWIPKSLIHSTDKEYAVCDKATKVTSIACGNFTWQEYNLLEH